MPALPVTLNMAIGGTLLASAGFPATATAAGDTASAGGTGAPSVPSVGSVGSGVATAAASAPGEAVGMPGGGAAAAEGTLVSPLHSCTAAAGVAAAAAAAAAASKAAAPGATAPAAVDIAPGGGEGEGGGLPSEGSLVDPVKQDREKKDDPRS